MSRILVVGGGFAGFWAAVAARRVVGSAAHVELVSRSPMLQIRPRLYEAEPHALQVDVSAPLSEIGVDFVQGEAIDLDPENGNLVLSSGSKRSFSQLVVATGSLMRRPNIPGASVGFSIDTVDEAVAFDRRLVSLADQDFATIAVVGAGFTGIELALELRDRLEIHCPRRKRVLRILLIDRYEEVGHELGAGPRAQIVAALESASVETRLGAEVVAITHDGVELAAGETIAADAVVLCTGMTAAPFAQKVPGERDSLGRVIVDRHLRAPHAPVLFVGGDACVADVGDGHLTLQSCQHALQLGRAAGENAGRQMLGEPLIDYRQTQYVTCLDLGRWGAVLTRGWGRKPILEGVSAKQVKRDINTSRIYPPLTGAADLLAASKTGELTAPSG